MATRRVICAALAALAAALTLAGCAQHARIIPESRLSRIYADMLIADQWIKDNPSQRKVADTTLFYEPIFRKYGYTTRDYQATVDKYIQDPEKFKKVVEATVGIIQEMETRTIQKRDLLDRIRRANFAIRGYQPKDFDTISLWPDGAVRDSVCVVLIRSLENEQFRHP